MASASGVSRWTRYFSIGSALSMVALQVAFFVEVPYRTSAVVGLFGAVLPMVFGMAYLLFPSYLGRTLTTRRLPGVHLVLTYVAVGLFVGDDLLSVDFPLAAVGTVCWSAGVAVFVGTLLRTVLPALAANPRLLRPSELRERRSSRLASVLIPVAVGYLVAGTVALLSLRTGVPTPFDGGFPMVVHFYATGFVTLLVFTLGLRLLTGFFHVTPPTPLSWFVLVCGGIAPAILSTSLWNPPWFQIGAVLEFAAMTGYAGLVAVVMYRTESRRVGLYGIGMGATAGVVAVGAASLHAFERYRLPTIGVHIPVVLNGFLVLTIIGYAYQFFPVTNGQFWGATRRTALSTMVLVGLGTLVWGVSAAADVDWLRAVGILCVLCGVTGYAYLLFRRH